MPLATSATSVRRICAAAAAANSCGFTNASAGSVSAFRMRRMVLLLMRTGGVAWASDSSDERPERYSFTWAGPRGRARGGARGVRARARPSRGSRARAQVVARRCRLCPPTTAVYRSQGTGALRAGALSGRLGHDHSAEIGAATRRSPNGRTLSPA